MRLKITGESALLMNRDSLMYDGSVAPKTRTETYVEYEEKIWKKKAHVKNGQVVFQGVWIRKNLIASQGLNAVPIKPPNARRATATLKQNLISGIYIEDRFPVMVPFKDKDRKLVLVKNRCPLMVLAKNKEGVLELKKDKDEKELVPKLVPATEDNLYQHKCMVSPQGKGKVLCIRPMINMPWEVYIDIKITDESIKEKDVIECLSWAGNYNGVGDWRPQKGGIYGRYNVRTIVEDEEGTHLI